MDGADGEVAGAGRARDKAMTSLSDLSLKLANDGAARMLELRHATLVCDQPAGCI